MPGNSLQAGRMPAAYDGRRETIRLVTSREGRKERALDLSDVWQANGAQLDLIGTGMKEEERGNSSSYRAIQKSALPIAHEARQRVAGP